MNKCAVLGNKCVNWGNSRVAIFNKKTVAVVDQCIHAALIFT